MWSKFQRHSPVQNLSLTQIPPQRSQRDQRDQRVREQRLNIPPQRGPGPIHKAGEPEDVERRRMVRHPNSHQLFFGNLPHEADKSELKDFFQNYGNVVEPRINSSGKLPNFGFVVFDDSESVQNNRPIMFPGVVRLNVEEKKLPGKATSGITTFRDLEAPVDHVVV